MKKEEYLGRLKNCIMSLTMDEQAEAIQYYSDYFDEAGDDEKVTQELGEPEELARTIIEKFANVPVSAENRADGEKENTSGATADGALFFSFGEGEQVENLDMNFGAAQIVVAAGDKFTVETRGIRAENMECSLAGGTLRIANTKRIQLLRFFSHDRGSRITPRILVTVPDNISLKNLSIKLGAGQLTSKGISIKCASANLNVGAGNLVLGGIFGGRMKIICGMGNLELTGSASGRSDIDCGMGNVELHLAGDRNEYSYDVKVGLGEFRFNDEKKSGVCQNVGGKRLANHFSVNCGMGCVKITTEPGLKN